MHKEKEKFCDISNGDLDLYFVEKVRDKDKMIKFKKKLCA